MTRQPVCLTSFNQKKSACDYVLGRLFGKGIDLDGSVALYAADKRLLDLIYFGKLRSDDGAIRHSGDDLKGYTFTSDRDNEVIDIALDKLSPEVQTLVFYINSYRGDTFEKLSFSRIRILEKTPDGSKPLASFFLEKEERFAGFTTMVMAKLFRSVDGAWEFEAIGEPLKDQKNSEAGTRTIEYRAACGQSGFFL